MKTMNDGQKAVRDDATRKLLILKVKFRTLFKLSNSRQRLSLDQMTPTCRRTSTSRLIGDSQGTPKHSLNAGLTKVLAEPCDRLA